MTGPADGHHQGVPHPRVRPFVSGYTGFRWTGLTPATHVGLPSGTLTFIVSFDEPLDVAMAADDSDRRTYWGMLAGLHDKPALVRHHGSQHGVQLDVTPRGAAALFGVSAGALGSTIAHLDSVVPSFADELIERLSLASTWRARWSILDHVFLRVMSVEQEMPVQLEQAWRLMRSSGGTVEINDVSAQIGWSRRHFSERFRDNFGLSPKVMARVLRFERAQKMVRLPTAPSLASVAAACGYADQAHMTREWNEFAGSSPTVWIEDELLGDGS